MGTHSDVAKLDNSGRLSIPSDVVKALGWERSDTHVALVAEWVDDGFLRLYREEDVRERIVARERELESAGEADQISALHDRYRTVTFYPKESRVRFPRVVIAALLGAETFAGDQLVYVEGAENCVGIFSHGARLRRLHSFAIDTNI